MRTNLIGLIVCLVCAGLSFGESRPQAVPTFHCVGLYWSPEDGAPENICRVRYRQATITARTWNEDFPMGRTVLLRDGPAPVVVNQSGSPDGYVLYTPAQGRPTATIDVAGQHPQCIEVRASYVILRGLTLKNAQQHGIRIFENCHDIVIENCDISGWGRIADDGYLPGRHLEAAHAMGLALSLDAA